jgi:protease I
MPGRALVIIAQKGYQDVELKGTRDGLLAAQYTVTLASTAVGPCVGKYNGTETAEVALKDADVAGYDKVAFIGGPGAFALKDDSDALRIAREAIQNGKVLGAICIAPTILAEAGVLNGKRATVANADGSPQKLLEEKGATYTGDPVTVDGRIVTANGPDAAEEFGKTLANLSA